jgi:Ala-tRNA(Pro) deacylase
MYNATPVIDYLDSRKILYRVDRHPKTATAQETAHVEHLSGKRFAKTVVAKSGHKLLLAVVPAHLKVDVEKLERLHGEGPLRLATEAEFAHYFPNCDVGAMPPFGHLYSQLAAAVPEPIEVYIDDDLAVAPSVTFNACSHEHTITLSGKDFLKATEGVVGDISLDPCTCSCS